MRSSRGADCGGVWLLLFGCVFQAGGDGAADRGSAGQPGEDGLPVQQRGAGLLSWGTGSWQRRVTDDVAGDVTDGAPSDAPSNAPSPLALAVRNAQGSVHQDI